MPIIGLQRRLREVGRIRIGQQVATSNGKTRPAKLGTFRFTSRDQRVIDVIAERYGGTSVPWTAPDGPQFEVVTDANELVVMIPPGDMSMTQWLETWSNGGCQKRCDGQWDTVRDVACDCDPEARECKITTRFSVLLPDVPALGLFRLESHGYYAGVELAGVIDICRIASERGQMLPARLRLEQRSVKRMVDGKPQTMRFAVPVIDIDMAVTALTAPNTISMTELVNEPDVQPVGWRPVPELPEGPPPPTVAEQINDIAVDKPPRKKRANAAQPIKPTGLAPVAGPRNCDLCGEPYGDASLKRNPVTGGSKYVHTACAEDVDTPAPTDLDGRGGTDAGQPPGPREPAPTVDPTTPNPGALRRKMYALITEVLPTANAKNATDADNYRRQHLLNMCAALGATGLTSRKDIDPETAGLVVDMLQGIKDGHLTWDGMRFNDVTTGGAT